MLLVNDDDYYDTLEILRGNKKLPDIFLELKDWLKETYNVTAYNFIFKKIKYNPPYKFQLYILLSSENEYNTMLHDFDYNEDKRLEIANKLYVLAQKHNLKKLHKYKDIWVCFNNFLVEMMTDINRCNYNKIEKELKKKFKNYSIWGIQPQFDATYVFYYSDEDVKRNLENGVSKQIKDDYFEELKKLDEFNVYTYDTFEMIFDSLENVDKNYKGNLYYYFK
ncbi:MAG: hypothetical protein GYA50_02880 [Eubacteriaceae bacterium]|nr:hypothetical protein [Eubacteriaceae bacterium]